MCVCVVCVCEFSLPFPRLATIPRLKSQSAQIFTLKRE